MCILLFLLKFAVISGLNCRMGSHIPEYTHNPSIRDVEIINQELCKTRE